MLFLALSSLAASFTFKVCSENGGSCSSNPYTKEQFTAQFLNGLYEYGNADIIEFEKETDSEGNLTLNFDGINPNFVISLYDTSTNSTLTIQTAAPSNYANTSVIPCIIAAGYNIVVQNSDTKAEYNTLQVRQTVEGSSIKSSDSRPLKIITDRRNIYYSGMSSSRYSSLAPIIGTSAYLNINDNSILVRADPNESVMYTIEPVQTYQRYFYNNLDFDDDYFIQSRLYVYLSVKATVTYGKKKVTLTFSNGKTITFVGAGDRIHIEFGLADESTVTCENNLLASDVIPPIVRTSSSSDSKGVTIRGNWPDNIKYRYPSMYLGKGVYVVPFSIYGDSLRGKIFYGAQNYPASSDYDSVNAQITLIEKNSSLSGFFDSDNITLLLQTEQETTLYIKGGIRTRANRREIYDDKTGSWTGIFYYEYPQLFAASPKLTIIASEAKEGLNLTGNAKYYVQKIDNSDQEIEKTIYTLRPGGTVIVPYTMSFNDVGTAFEKIYNDFASKNPEPPEKSKFIEYWNYYIKFATNKAGELSEALETLAMKPVKLNINAQALAEGQKNRLQIRRMDYPVASLYSLNLNKEFPAVCSSSGTLDLSQWELSYGKDLIKGLLEYFEASVDDVDEYLPQIKDTAIEGEFVSTDNKKCIGFKNTKMPASTFELVVFTTNTTYLEIMKKISIISLLTADDLEVTNKLKNKASRNIFLVAMDDTPSGKSINLKGISEEANVFLFGAPFKAFDDVMNAVEYIDGLNGSDPNIDFEKLMLDKICEVVKKYKTYLPKVNVIFDDRLQTLFTFTTELTTSHLECSTFVSFASSVVATEFNAATTITDSQTFELMKSLTFNILVILPVSLDPPNLYVVDQIKFEEDGWLLHYAKGYLDQYKSFEVKPTTHKIPQNRVTSQLLVYSMTDNIDFNVPETIKGKVYGAGITTEFTSITVKDFPGMFTLEGVTSRLRGEIAEILHGITSAFTSKNAHLLEGGEGEGSTSTTSVKFTGSWDKVTEIVGEMPIDVGSTSVVAQNIPDVALQVLDIKAKSDVNLQPTSKTTAFTTPQVIKAADKKYIFPEGHTVTFKNITFYNTKGKTTADLELSGAENGDESATVLGLSLMIGAKESEIKTEDLLITKATIVDVGTLSVSKSLEFGPEAQLMASSLKADSTKLTLGYQLGSSFATFPDSLAPSSIVLSYVGDGSSVDDEIDYSSYLGSVKTIKSFDTEEACNNWKGMISYSSRYTSFDGDKSVVSSLCQKDATTNKFSLAINVTSVPTGEMKPDEVAPGDPTEKKLPIGAIVGGVVGGVALIAIISVLVWFFAFRKKKAPVQAEDESKP
ncbi:hypothetical protein TRFO_14134 [Tritrichomonas foetus]|uniref:VWFA domain-containing protein n=1 Tax=Tritrichomonas foetus TaxID=1144522 RepID=A0A1J4L093_9EUKA|nr:hypothetical protein TRFO_14134 [Tritrichomonas foetus]|eukprot:OHT15382.1 hypothetical protein TRFO_14134 [Tritrichomonas foetus]